MALALLILATFLLAFTLGGIAYHQFCQWRMTR